MAKWANGSKIRACRSKRSKGRKPGQVQCPFHCHYGEEEMFLILEGEGELRFGDKRYPIRKHGVIVYPPGGPEDAHQTINTGTTTIAIYRSLPCAGCVDGRVRVTFCAVASSICLRHECAGLGYFGSDRVGICRQFDDLSVELARLGRIS